MVCDDGARSFGHYETNERRMLVQLTPCCNANTIGFNRAWVIIRISASAITMLSESSVETPAVQALRVLDVNPHTDRRWQAFVLNHPNGSIYHHPSWIRALEEEYGQKAAHLACENERGELVAILPLLTRAACRFSSVDHWPAPACPRCRERRWRAPSPMTSRLQRRCSAMQLSWRAGIPACGWKSRPTPRNSTESSPVSSRAGGGTFTCLSYPVRQAPLGSPRFAGTSPKPPGTVCRSGSRIPNPISAPGIESIWPPCAGTSFRRGRIVSLPVSSAACVRAG